MLGENYALGRDHVFGHPALMDLDTGLVSRLHFELVCNYLFEAGDRGMAFSLMLLSVERPDTESTDLQPPKRLGEKIRETTRATDIVTYVGGSRYVVLLLGTNLQGARVAADRVEMALEGLAPGPVSFGLTAYRPQMEELLVLFEAADAALLTAEAAGGGVEVT